MLRDNFFKMSMQKPLQHSFVYGSVWPTILKDKDTTKTENVKVLIVTNTWICEGYYHCHGGCDFTRVCLLGGGWVFDFGLKNLAYLVIISGGGLLSTAYCSIVVLWGFNLEVSVVSFLLCLFENWFTYIIGFCCSRLLSSHCYRWCH